MLQDCASYCSLPRTNVSTTGLRYSRSQPRIGVSATGLTTLRCAFVTALRDISRANRPTRRADATSTRRTRSSVAETPLSSSFALPSQRSRFRRPLRQFFTHPPTPILRPATSLAAHRHALDKPAYALRVRYVYVRRPTRPDDPRGALPSHQARWAFLGSTSTEARSRPLPRTPLIGRLVIGQPLSIDRQAPATRAPTSGCQGPFA